MISDATNELFGAFEPWKQAEPKDPNERKDAYIYKNQRRGCLPLRKPND